MAARQTWQPNRTAQKTALARRLITDEKIIRFEHATLSSGLLTPFMIDLQSLTPLALGEVATYLRDIVTERQLAFSHVAGVPTGGDAFAQLVARLYYEKKTIRLFKAGGRMRVDDGSSFSVGNRVLVIEDVFTTGRSALATAHALAIWGLEIIGVIAVCDREQGGRRACEACGYPTAALFTARELLTIAQQTHVVTEERYQECLTYLAQW